MKTSLALASLVAVTLATSAAHADGDSVKPPSRRAHAAGVALTITGASFLGTGVVAGAGSLALMFSGDNGGVAFAVLGGLISAGCLVVGVSTLIPGIVLMNDNRLSHPVVSPAFRDAQKAPSFTSVPILSATF